MLRSPGYADRERIGRGVDAPVGRSFRPRCRPPDEDDFGSANLPCGRRPRVSRRFAVAFVAAPWAVIGPPRLGLFGDFVASEETVNIRYQLESQHGEHFGGEGT